MGRTVNVEEYTADQVRALLPWPAPDTHKYARGKLVAVAGSAAYPGAACLAALAAQRMGAGYVEVVCAPESVRVVQGFRPSLVVSPWDGWKPPAGLAEPQAARPCACLIGPGFDARDTREQRLLGTVLQDVAAPVLVDGGALAVLATSTGLALARRRAHCGRPLVMTPHVGEAARLEEAAGLVPATDPAERARNLARAYRGIVALKGPDTFVSNDERTVAVRQGTAALAKAGTGDVLAGMAGALLAQGLDPLDAAVLGATLHARAGCVAAERLTSICVTPEDVIDFIPHVINDVR